MLLLLLLLVIIFLLQATRQVSKAGLCQFKDPRCCTHSALPAG
jgi:hypothetical protein